MGKTVRAEAAWVTGHRFVATTGSGHALVIDNPGREDGRSYSPMELILAGVAGCGGIDVVSMLEKMREPLETLEIAVEGERRDEHPKIYTCVTLVYRARGEVDAQKLLRAVDLSESTYCSALAMVKSGAEVKRRVELNGEVVAE